ncbi:S41 family peptidase [Niabella hibiscisoli]|uniref:S41 family peptidase n=1 Tax=Niabella hibiscisoli TaxID=1825928 RepID=UPI001F0F9137|nr:S41 family peptidase [Niabella hibiscisoli]MCH5716042.1 S41 family peptidase [Niabella hibiscisoli]
MEPFEVAVKMIPVFTHGDVYRKLIVSYCSRFLALVLCASLFSCAGSRKTFNPNKKFSAAQLNEDYQLFQNILEQKHPSLYWYSTKNQMDSAFTAGRELLKDSMTEYQFRNLLALVISNIQCGHTSVRSSTSYQKHFDTLQSKRSFPLNVKTWKDTMVLTAPVKNTPLLRGDIIDSINGVSTKHILDTLLRFIPADGNNMIAKSQLLSGTSYFASLYTGVFGWPKPFRIAYTDSLGHRQQTTIQPVIVPKDSISKTKKKPAGKDRKSKAEKLKEQRNLQLWPNEDYAVMDLATFSGSPGLKRFFRKSFKTLADSGIANLVIDLRLNGGGRITNSNYLTRYLADKPFKTGDSIYARRPSFKYGQFIKNSFTETLYTLIPTRKKGDQYHFRHFENKYYQPNKRNHYNGHIYMLTGGYTYSASVLVLNAIAHQPNVTIVGEPSGGAAYGNTAMIIPNVTLPHTKVRFRLPLFRLVMNKNTPHNGKGVQPDVYVNASPGSIREGVDTKMVKALELIKGSSHEK